MIDWKFPEQEAFNLPAPPRTPLAYVELALDPVTWDLAIPIIFLRDVDAVIQRIRIRFRFFYGEWFLDTRLGIHYYRDILIKNPDRLVITAIFRKVLLSCPGVKAVVSFVADLDRATRTLTATFEAVLDDGTKVISQAEPFIIGG